MSTPSPKGIVQALETQVDRSSAEALCEVMTLHSLSAGDALLAPGQAQPDLWFLLDEGFEVRIEEDGQTLSLGALPARSWVGEAGFLGEQPTGATVVATRDGHALCLAQATFQRLLEDEPRLTSQLLRRLCVVLSERIYDSNAGTLAEAEDGSFVLEHEAPSTASGTGLLSRLAALMGGRQHG